MSTESSQKSTQKLYVGNVEYKTTKTEIHDLFKDYNVKSVEIPTIKLGRKGEKGSRTKGYVFVNFGSDADLDTIIEKFTDFEFNGRKIYLRYPKPKSEQGEGEGEGEGAKEAEKSANTSETKKKSKSKSKPKAETPVDETEPQAKKPSNSKPKRQPKEKIPFDQGIKSTNTIYVRNLDRSLKVVDIREYFTKEDETPVWISVPLFTLPRPVLKKLEAEGKSLERRNKGYAFVRFELKEGETIDDKVNKFNGKKFNDNELQVSIAVDVRNTSNKEQEETEEKEKEKETGEAVN